MVNYVIYFIIYGAIGWVLDSASRSLEKRKFIEASYFGIPFMPVYGVGGLTIVLLIPVLSSYNILTKFLVYGVSLAILEYIAGVFVEKTKNKRLWDYSKSKFNLHGRTDLTRAICWGILALITEYYIHPLISQFI